MAETQPAAKGADVIQAYVRTLPGAPGVYRMLDARGEALYIGKAKSLKKRVASYTQVSRLSIRIARMVAQTASMEFVSTHTEAEALLMESNLIKQYKPRYNILLRDDKSFPNIHLTSEHTFPRVLKHRGAKGKGEYFGPYASVWAVNHTLTILQRAFKLRPCSDSVFESRTRPCLQYQIKRCSAPCVGRISEDDYGQSAAQARAFLKGDSKTIQEAFAKRMQQASDAQDYEQAAEYRDRIRALTWVQSRQDVNPGGGPGGVMDADVIAAHQDAGQTCVEVFLFRAGMGTGNRAYFPSHAKDAAAPEVLEAFIGQFYARTPPPKTVIVSHTPPNAALVAEALSLNAGRRVRIEIPKRGLKHQLTVRALQNARDALARRMSENASQRRLLEGLAERLELDAPPERIEVYDNSHVQGAKAVGAMIAAGPEGFIKKAYRKYNFKGAKGADNPEGFTAGDDFAMMREVLMRRFSRALKEDPDRERGQWPDLVMIDGGKGQLSSVQQVMDDLGISGVALCAVAKGPDRNAGREVVHRPAKPELALPERDPVLYFIQRLRDEAHRFAIGAHRDKRAAAIRENPLDAVPGVGARRKRGLLHHFGSAKAVAEAGVRDLAAVEGVSARLAQTIYDWFHSDT
ncbi:MAG: excinuclease ABC subunit UvrC [Rhodospirillales bacterium]